MRRTVIGRMQDSWPVPLISCYLYGLCGISLLVLISPAIVFSVPVLVLLGPPCVKWWLRRHSDDARLGPYLRWWLVVAAVVLAASPVVPAVWYIVDDSDGATPESGGLLLTAIVLAPLAIASVAYAISAQRE